MYPADAQHSNCRQGSSNRNAEWIGAGLTTPRFSNMLNTELAGVISFMEALWSELSNTAGVPPKLVICTIFSTGPPPARAIHMDVSCRSAAVKTKETAVLFCVALTKCHVADEPRGEGNGTSTPSSQIHSQPAVRCRRLRIRMGPPGSTPPTVTVVAVSSVARNATASKASPATNTAPSMHWSIKRCRTLQSGIFF